MTTVTCIKLYVNEHSLLQLVIPNAVSFDSVLNSILIASDIEGGREWREKIKPTNIKQTKESQDTVNEMRLRMEGIFSVKTIFFSKLFAS